MSFSDPKRIGSASNPVFKHVLQLVRRNDLRRESGQVWLEGEHLVQAWMGSGRDLLYLVVTEAASLRIPWLAQVPAAQRIVLPDGLFARLSSLPSPTGVAAVIQEPRPVASKQPELDAIYLDRIQDPGNLGTLLRSASAAGIARIFLSHQSTSAWSAKALRAGMGAQFLLEVIEPIDFEQARALSAQRIVVAHPAAKVDLYGTDLQAPVLWVFGSEGQGVSAEILERADVERVMIPQRRQQESLNVAMAATVCLFEQQRQRSARQAASA